MCGCNSSGGSSSCGGTRKVLRALRTRLVTLYNITTDFVKKAEYNQLKSEIDTMYKDKTICPDAQLVVNIKIYIDSEYAKLN